MAKKTKHSIQKQSFEISYNNSENALKFQQEISNIIKQNLAKITEEIFDKYAPKDVILRIDTLEIDLGNVPYKQMEKDILRKYHNALQEAIQKEIVQAKNQVNSNVEFIIPKFALIDIFLIYLQTGVLPWWFESSLGEFRQGMEDKVEDINDVLDLLLKENPHLLRETYLANKTNKNVVKRTVKQFSNQSIFSIFAIFTNLDEIFILKIYQQILGLLKKSLDLNMPQLSFRNLFFEIFFISILSGNRFVGIEQKQVIEKVLLSLAFVHKISTQRFWEIIHKVSTTESIDISLREVIEENYQNFRTKDSSVLWQESSSLELFKESTEFSSAFSEEKVISILEQIYPKEANIIQKFVLEFIQYLSQKISIPNLQRLTQQVWELIIGYIWQQQAKSFLDLEELFIISLENILNMYVQRENREKFIVEIAEQLSVFDRKSEDILAKKRKIVNESWQQKESLDKLFQSYDENKIIEVLEEILANEEVIYLQKFVKNLAKLLKTKLELNVSEKQVQKEVWQKLIDFFWVNRFIKISISALLQNVFKISLKTYQITEKYPVYQEILEDISKDVKELQVSLAFFDKEQRGLIQDIWLDSSRLETFLRDFEEFFKREFILSDLQSLGLEDFYIELSKELNLYNISTNIIKVILETIWEDKRQFPNTKVLLEAILPKLDSLRPKKESTTQALWSESESLAIFLASFSDISGRSFELSDLLDIGFEKFYQSLSEKLNLRLISDTEKTSIFELLWQHKKEPDNIDFLLEEISNYIENYEEKYKFKQDSRIIEEKWEDFEVKTWLVQYDENKVLVLLKEVIPEKAFWLESFVKNLAIYLQSNEILKQSIASLRKISWETLVWYLWQKRFTSFEEELFLENVLAKILDKLKVKNPEKILQESKNFLRQKIKFEEVIEEISLEQIIENIFTKGVLKWEFLLDTFSLNEFRITFKEYLENQENQEKLLILLSEAALSERVAIISRLQDLLTILSIENLPQKLQEKIDSILSKKLEFEANIDRENNLNEVLQTVDLMIYYLDQYLKEQNLSSDIIPDTEDFMLIMIQMIQTLGKKHEDIFKDYLQTLEIEAQNKLKQFHPTIIGNLLEDISSKPKKTVIQTNVKVLQELKKMLDDSKRLSKKWMSSEIYIKNAGLVLLGAYLGRYLKFLEMTEGTAFKNFEMQERTVLLLQYLASKQTKAEESDLILNKILAGLPIDEPIINEIEMTQKEIDTSENLLSAVITNWGALGKTSNDNLRASFLLREGKLLNTKGAWKLTIPGNALDTLLQKMSWSFKIIKLPWMPKAIEVEWEF